MEQKRLCPFCMGELPPAATRLSPLREDLRGMQPGGQPAGGHAVGRAVYRGRDAERRRRGHPVPGRGEHGRFRVTIKEYMPLTLSAERGTDALLRPSWAAKCCKTTRMDFADLYRSIQRITPANGLEAVLDVLENNTVYAVMENPGGIPLQQWLENRPQPGFSGDAQYAATCV